MIRLLARVYTQKNYQTNYLFRAKVRPDGLSVASINRANVDYTLVKIFVGIEMEIFYEFEVWRSIVFYT